MRKILFGLMTLIMIFLLSSCMVTQKMTVDRFGGGTSDIRLDTTDYFKTLIVDLTSFDQLVANSDKDPDTIILDNSIGTLWSNLESSPAQSYTYFYRTEEKAYIGTVAFTDLSRLINDLDTKASQEEIDSLLSVTDRNLKLEISMDNYHVLTEIVPFLTEENFEAYGPVYNHGSTEADYLEMMDFILGDETSQQILDSRIDLSFTVPGHITSTNGTETAQDEVVFSIPLLKLLLLNENITCYCNWD